MEVWKPVVGYEGIYEVSNLGKVKSLERLKYCGHKGSKPQKVREKILTTRADRLGYIRVKLSKGNKSKTKHLHRVVAKAFIPNREGYKEVNHIDGIKENNKPENLEWVTRRGNMRHAFEKGLLNPPTGESNHLSKLKESQVREIRELYENKDFTQKELSIKYNVTIANISCIVNYKTWKEVIL